MEVTTLYEQLVESIKKRIICGELKINDKLDSERSMAQKYGINRMTVRKAIKCLQEQGIIQTLPGKGNYVIEIPTKSNKIELGQGSDLSLSVQIRQKGLKSSREMISFKKIKAENEVKDYFPESEYVYEIIRLSLINDNPYAVQQVYIPCSLFKEAERFDFIDGSLYSYMRDQGHTPTTCISDLKIDAVDITYCDILNIDSSKNIFIFTYFYFDEEHKMIEYTRSYNLPEYTSFTYRGVVKDI